jgi:hypothetical protein
VKAGDIVECLDLGVSKMNVVDKVAVFFLTGIFIFSTVWYTDYITKRNAMLRDIMVCMGDDNSLESYKGCAKE